ncbi:ABC transporter ATP-binding protein [Aggregatilinea lenta]|uniref:ABC transporter ATP-binding protein n=1 Tax=Aggregatilinea lenta TaxID=913108 RepID=UPI000E5C2468|nr:ABC transporter ATP-binding protein [Aggregatilinea lenta]
MAKSNGSPPPVVVSIRDLSKTYSPGCADCAVLDGVSLDIHQGDFVVLLGVSGSGKSTLLNLISGLDQPTSGSLHIDGTEITTLNEYQRTVFRRDRIGIVFQFFNLIPTLTVLENVTLPLELRGDPRKSAEQRARTLLERVGLADRANDFPDKLSGGEQQRIAIARALIHQPALVLADEPTGNLDEDTGERVLTLLLELTRQAGRTLLMATHNPDIVPLADRVYRIQDGQLVPVVDALHTTLSERQ